jgi:hypothetical protein
VPPSIQPPPAPAPAQAAPAPAAECVRSVRPSGPTRISRWQSVERVPDCDPRGYQYPNMMLTIMARKKLNSWIDSGGLDKLFADVALKRSALDESNELWASMPQAIC